LGLRLISSVPHRLSFDGRVVLVAYTHSELWRRLPPLYSRSRRYSKFLGERVFGLHFTDLVIGSERDGLLLGLPSRNLPIHVSVAAVFDHKM